MCCAAPRRSSEEMAPDLPNAFASLSIWRISPLAAGINKMGIYHFLRHELKLVAFTCLPPTPHELQLSTATYFYIGNKAATPRHDLPKPLGMHNCTNTHCTVLVRPFCHLLEGPSHVILKVSRVGSSLGIEWPFPFQDGTVNTSQMDDRAGCVNEPSERVSQ